MEADTASALSLLLEIVRTAAIVAGAIFIPVALHRASRASDQQRTTLELSRNIFTEPLILERMERLFRYRAYLADAGDSSHAVNPYAGDPLGYRWDHVLVLNFYEGVCSEVEQELSDADVVFSYAGGTIAGVRDVIFARMEAEGVVDASSYPNLLAVAERVKRWAARADGGDGVTESIPLPAGD